MNSKIFNILTWIPLICMLGFSFYVGYICYLKGDYSAMCYAGAPGMVGLLSLFFALRKERGRK